MLLADMIKQAGSHLQTGKHTPADRQAAERSDFLSDKAGNMGGDK
jgi:hypothetical protein